MKRSNLLYFKNFKFLSLSESRITFSHYARNNELLRNELFSRFQDFKFCEVKLTMITASLILITKKLEIYE
jgi:hypothetical protein